MSSSHDPQQQAAQPPQLQHAPTTYSVGSTSGHTNVGPTYADNVNVYNYHADPEIVQLMRQLLASIRVLPGQFVDRPHFTNEPANDHRNREWQELHKKYNPSAADPQTSSSSPSRPNGTADQLAVAGRIPHPTPDRSPSPAPSQPELDHASMSSKIMKIREIMANAAQDSTIAQDFRMADQIINWPQILPEFIFHPTRTALQRLATSSGSSGGNGSSRPSFSLEGRSAHTSHGFYMVIRNFEVGVSLGRSAAALNLALPMFGVLKVEAGQAVTNWIHDMRERKANVKENTSLATAKMKNGMCNIKGWLQDLHRAEDEVDTTVDFFVLRDLSRKELETINSLQASTPYAFVCFPLAGHSFSNCRENVREAIRSLRECRLNSGAWKPHIVLVGFHPGTSINGPDGTCRPSVQNNSITRGHALQMAHEFDVHAYIEFAKESSEARYTFFSTIIGLVCAGVTR